MAHLRLRSDDAGGAEICRREDLCCLMYPDMLGNFSVILTQRRAKSQDHILDSFKGLPGIGELLQIRLCLRVVQII